MEESRAVPQPDTDTGAGERIDEYRLAVRGHLGAQATEWFEGLTVTNRPGGIAEIVGPIVDQAALYALLARIQSLGLSLLAINRGPPDTPPSSDRAQ